MTGHLKSLIAKMSLKEDAKVFSCRFAARSLLVASTADCSFSATLTHLFESYSSQMPFSVAFSFSFHTLGAKASWMWPCSRDVDRPTRPHPAQAAGFQISYLFRRKGWIELAGCKEGASVASLQQNPLHTLLGHLERMPVAVFRSVNRELCQFKGIHS